jgi:hypothetical protein
MQALYIWQQGIVLEQTRVVYTNPRVVTQQKTVVVRGPVRVVERIIREPGGREEVVREEVRGPVIETMEAFSLSEPVFPPTPRTDRWLLGFGLEPFHHLDHRGWRGHGGYSFRNRLDVQVGLNGRGRIDLDFTVRF